MSKFLYDTLTNIANHERVITQATLSDGSNAFGDFTLEGAENSRAVIVYGDNASGKSLVGRILVYEAGENDIEARSVSMAHRVTSSGLARVAVYGGESEQSTGVTSYKAAQRGINATACEPDLKSLLVLDEPDVGLSNRYAKALGKHIADSFNSMGDEKYLVLVTHNESLLRGFLEAYKRPMATLGVGTKQTLTDWLDNPDECSIEELVDLEKLAFKRWSAFDRQFDLIRAQSNKRRCA